MLSGGLGEEDPCPGYIYILNFKLRSEGKRSSGYSYEIIWFSD